MKVGERGQVVIPKKLRDHYGLHPGASLVFIEEGGRLILKPQRTTDASAWQSAVGILRGKIKPVDAFVEETRGR